jgi:hypothetical protein
MEILPIPSAFREFLASRGNNLFNAFLPPIIKAKWRATDTTDDVLRKEINGGY